MKIYIGDSVYAEIKSESNIILTVDIGFGITDRICLEKNQLENLLHVISNMEKTGE